MNLHSRRQFWCALVAAIVLVSIFGLFVIPKSTSGHVLGITVLSYTNEEPGNLIAVVRLQNRSWSREIDYTRGGVQTWNGSDWKDRIPGGDGVFYTLGPKKSVDVKVRLPEEAKTEKWRFCIQTITFPSKFMQKIESFIPSAKLKSGTVTQTNLFSTAFVYQTGT